jgi:hypothetical protein
MYCCLQVHDGALYVNGEARREPFIYQQPTYTLGKLVVPPGDVSAANSVKALAADCCCTLLRNVAAVQSHIACRISVQHFVFIHLHCDM